MERRDAYPTDTQHIVNLSGYVWAARQIPQLDRFRVLDLASEVIRLTGSTSSIIYKPLPFDDPKQRCPDLTKVKTVLNWEAKTSLEQGLIATIRYFEKRLALKKRPLTSACASNT